jgi:hypothetical protein
LLSEIEVIVHMGARAVKIFGDSKLTVQQVKGESQCWDGVLNEYKEKCLEALDGVDRFNIEHIPQGENHRANELVQQALGYDIRKGMFDRRRKPMAGDVLVIQTNADASATEDRVEGRDWRYALTEYIKDPSCNRDHKIQRQALRYTLINDVLHHRTVDGLLL